MVKWESKAQEEEMSTGVYTTTAVQSKTNNEGKIIYIQGKQKAVGGGCPAVEVGMRSIGEWKEYKFDEGFRGTEEWKDVSRCNHVEG